MTDDLIEKIASEIRGYFSGADKAYGEHVKCARAALAAIEASGTHSMIDLDMLNTLKASALLAAHTFKAINDDINEARHAGRANAFGELIYMLSHPKLTEGKE